MMHPARIARVAAAGLACLILVSLAATLAAANTVPVSGADQSATAVAIGDLVPPDCRSFRLDSIISGSGILDGSNRSDLMLGSAGPDIISGFNQKDCLLGGGGIDTLNGGNAEDALFGGDGDDMLDGGAGPDVCYGGAGVDIFINCETAFP